MIPNLVHYCWFSGEEMPEVVKRCIESWHKWLPGYQFRLWDMDAVREIDSPYMREALQCHKWAFASDYVRLWAVEKYGGIYIDTDVELFGSLDPFRGDQMFIGREIGFHVMEGRPWNLLTSHIFGAQAHHPFLKSCLRYYDGRHFVITDDESLPEEFRYDLRISPHVKAVIAHSGYGYDPSLKSDFRQHCKDGLEVYPSQVFDGTFPSGVSVCRHLCLGGWRSKKNGETGAEENNGKVPLLGRLVSPQIKYKCFRMLKKIGYIFMRI